MNLVKPYQNSKLDKTKQVKLMFDNVSESNDKMNRILSLRTDVLWRRKAINKIKIFNPSKILDVATGTGDLLIEMDKRLQANEIVGIDISEKMLKICQTKIKNSKSKITLLTANSEEIPYDDNTFDLATSAFGVRNFENLDKCLSEIYRVLKPNSHIMILELSDSESKLLKTTFGFYFNKIVPKIGRIISKDGAAYDYLPNSVAAFTKGKEFLQILSKAGFKETSQTRLSFGICSIYTGKKK